MRSDEGMVGSHELHRFTGRGGDSTQGVVKAGDMVLIAAEVVDDDYTPEEVKVRLWSKEGPYVTVVDRGRIWAMLLPAPPDEPVDGTWLHCNQGTDEETVLFRDDDRSPQGPVSHRRWPQRWRDVAAKEWISWPEAALRGAPHDWQAVTVTPDRVAELAREHDAHPLLREVGNRPTFSGSTIPENGNTNPDKEP